MRFSVDKGTTEEAVKRISAYRSSEMFEGTEGNTLKSQCGYPGTKKGAKLRLQTVTK